MYFQALATDFDGTIACDGVVDDRTLAALRDARDRGMRLCLVTGRELSSLANTFAHVDVFDRIIAENGAVLFDPRAGSPRLLSPTPPPALIARLTERHVPISVGHSIVATVDRYEDEVSDALRELGLPWQIILNKDAVMVLPLDVTKATGLRFALDELGIPLERTVGVGDAENDQALLAECGLAAAVGNALDSLKACADVVMTGTYGAGVAELLTRVAAGEFETAEVRGRRRGGP